MRQVLSTGCLCRIANFPSQTEGIPVCNEMVFSRSGPRLDLLTEWGDHQTNITRFPRLMLLTDGCRNGLYLVIFQLGREWVKTGCNKDPTITILQVSKCDIPTQLCQHFTQLFTNQFKLTTTLCIADLQHLLPDPLHHTKIFCSGGKVLFGLLIADAGNMDLPKHRCSHCHSTLCGEQLLIFIF